MSPGSMRWMAFALLLLVAAGIGLGVWHGLTDDAFRTRLGTDWSAAPAGLWGAFSGEIVLNPWFYAVFALVLLLERLVPADPAQSPLARGVRQDAVWVPFTLVLHAFFLPIYILFLRTLYQRYLGFLTIESVADWPWIARVLLAVLVSDLLFWVSHYVRHKVMVLWYFHAVHHSQKELNFFTEYRVHPLDDVFLYTIGFVPFFMVEHSFISIVAVTWIRHWHTRVYHANIRSNFGPLRYLLVTPQSHRVHHSVERRHFDKNFGLTFSIWDHLFGTQYRGYDEYPATGIPDQAFPFEQAGEARFGFVGRLASQLLYPFEAIAARARGAASTDGSGSPPGVGVTADRRAGA